MSFALRIVLFLPLTFTVYAKANGAPVCINRDASPNELIFVNEMNKPTPGGFIDEWKKEQALQNTSAQICTDCLTPEEPKVLTPAASSLDVKAIASAAESGSESKTEFHSKVQKSFWGGHYYLDENGKKIKLSKQEAMEMRLRESTDKMQMEIDASTRKIIKDRRLKSIQERHQDIQKNIQTERKEFVQTRMNKQIMKKNDISQMCIQRTLEKLRPAANKRLCKNDSGSAPASRNVPCITEDIANYMTWSMNKAFDCINDMDDPLDSKLFFKKINHESNYNFWVESNNGRGLGQMTFVGMQEVMGSGYNSNSKSHYKYDGRNMLERIMKNNKTNCQRYYKIANPDLPNNESMYKRPYNANKCAQMSLDAGIQTNLLASIALYKFYRDEQPTYSSENVMQNLKIPKTNPDYSRMKNLLALMSYSAINPQGARSIAESRKYLMKPNMTYEQFEEIIKGRYNPNTKRWTGGHPRASYLRAIDDTFRNIQSPGEDLQCTGK